jgi:23S rRNA (guanosine2251-2'-O)-methyltransferase
MSPRFQRRPEGRSGSGGAGRPGDRWAKRSGTARPSRGWGGAKPEWRPDAAGGSESRGQRRSSSDERPRPRFAERRSEGGGTRGERRFKPEGGYQGQRRFGGERSFSGERRFGADRRSPRRERDDERRGPQSFSDRAPQGEAETHLEAAPSDLIWGRHPAEAALESGRPIHRIWCTPELRHTPRFLQLLREAKASGVLVEEVTWARLGQLTGGAVHQGIVLQSAAAETLDLPSLIEGCAQIGEPPLLMAIDGLTDPHNLGAIVRSAEALGAHGMVLPQRRCAGLTGSVAKVAAGALEHLPVARVVNLNRALDSLKQEGYRVVGLAAEGSVTLEEADLEGPLVVVTGSEGDGLSLLTRRSCDQLVRIPLRGSTPSLNASVATALLLFEIARRGWMRGLTGQAPAPRIQRPQLPSPAAVEPAPSPLVEVGADGAPGDSGEVSTAMAAEPAPASDDMPLNDPWQLQSSEAGFSSDISL